MHLKLMTRALMSSSPRHRGPCTGTARKAAPPLRVAYGGTEQGTVATRPLSGVLGPRGPHPFGQAGRCPTLYRGRDDVVLIQPSTQKLYRS